MDLTIQEIRTLAVNNNVNFYEQILLLIANKVGPEKTMQGAQVAAKNQSIVLSDYELYLIDIRTA